MARDKVPQKSTGRLARVRKDIEVKKQILDSEPVYIAKDPLSLAYFRMGEVEYHIFTLLDGAHDAEAIRAAIADKYAGLEIDKEEVELFIQRLKGYNFLEGLGPHGDSLLYARSRLKRKLRFKQTLMSFLFIKIPLCDPDEFLDRTYPYLRFLWTRTFVVLYGLLGITALGLLLANLSDVTFQIWGFLSASNIILFWLALVFIKALHELGHAYTCKHFGGEVHELGILLVVFTPWAYCNVSDANTFARSRDRFLVSVAGILTELFIASIATIVWWVTAPGVLNNLAYATMLICSLNNILFNGNPLLRYDGYYALSDYLEIPNLRVKAGAFVKSRLKALFRRVPQDEDPNLTERRKAIYWIYGVLSFFYRIFIILFIMGFLSSRFFGLGILLAMMLLVTVFVLPVIRTFSALWREKGTLEWRTEVLLPLCAGLLILFALSFLYSREVEVKAPATIESSNRAYLRAEVAGELKELLVGNGEHVGEGQLIGVLRNPELEASLKKLEIELFINEQNKGLALDQRKYADYVTFEVNEKTLRKEVEELEKKVSRLNIVSPVDGVVLTRNIKEKKGNYFHEGDFIAEVGGVDKAIVRIIVPESDISDVRVGQSVGLKVYANPAKTYSGKVLDISPARSRSIENLAMSSKFGGDFPTRTDVAAGQEVPEITLFQISVEMDDQGDFLLPGMTAVAKIYGEESPAAVLLWRKVLRMVKPRLWF